ncbi:dienelactone hydrolase family protein [Tamlana flava]|uniref:dienelactone hydrolase family protein n=1 Tax=Tamlana flava TaxID=3158572 RepID=UPI00351AB9B4
MFADCFNTHAQELHERIKANHKIYIPEGKGPFPVVIAFPGCSGVSLNGQETDAGRPGDEADRLFRRHYSRMAIRLQEASYMVLLVDYLTSESISNTCGWEIHPKRVGEYVSDAISFVRTIPNSDLTRINVIGWSHGGEGVLAWLDKLEQEARGVKSAIAVYPGCSSIKPWKTSLPVLMILGEADDIALPDICNTLVQSLPNKTNVFVRSYPNARHGFDLTEGPTVLPVGKNLNIGRNQKAGDNAWNEIFNFLENN